MNSRMRKPLLWLIRLYQMTLSKTIPPGSCRFYPTCSHYGYEAIEVHGVIKGSGMAIWRVVRCNPWSKGGFDPVPPRKVRGGAPQLENSIPSNPESEV